MFHEKYHATNGRHIVAHAAVVLWGSLRNLVCSHAGLLFWLTGQTKS